MVCHNPQKLVAEDEFTSTKIWGKPNWLVFMWIFCSEFAWYVLIGNYTILQGYHQSNKAYPGKVSLSSLQKSARQKTIDMGKTDDVHAS